MVGKVLVRKDTGRDDVKHALVESYSRCPYPTTILCAWADRALFKRQLGGTSNYISWDATN